MSNRLPRDQNREVREAARRTFAEILPDGFDARIAPEELRRRALASLKKARVLVKPARPPKKS